jgi:hypothetical protein
MDHLLSKEKVATIKYIVAHIVQNKPIYSLFTGVGVSIGNLFSFERSVIFSKLFFENWILYNMFFLLVAISSTMLIKIAIKEENLL